MSKGADERVPLSSQTTTRDDLVPVENGKAVESFSHPHDGAEAYALLRHRPVRIRLERNPSASWEELGKTTFIPSK